MSKVSEKLKNDPLVEVRHSAEHVLHMAMQILYPELKKAMGPATEDGYYFDFDLEQKISPEDFPNIEAKMQETKLKLVKIQVEGKKPQILSK